jgi:hypothetical protein
MAPSCLDRRPSGGVPMCGSRVRPPRPPFGWESCNKRASPLDWLPSSSPAPVDKRAGSILRRSEAERRSPSSRRTSCRQQNNARNNQSTLGNIQSTLGNVQSTSGNNQSTFGNIQSILGNIQSTLGNTSSESSSTEWPDPRRSAGILWRSPYWFASIKPVARRTRRYRSA